MRNPTAKGKPREIPRPRERPQETTRKQLKLSASHKAPSQAPATQHKTGEIESQGTRMAP